MISPIDYNKVTRVPTNLLFQPLRTLLKILSCERPGLPSVTLALFLQLHHLREHAADPADRSIGAVHHERKLSARFDGTIHHGVGGRACTARYHARHGVLFLPEETGAVSGGPGADAQHPGTAGDRTGSHYGDLSQCRVHGERRRQDLHLSLAIRILREDHLNKSN